MAPKAMNAKQPMKVKSAPGNNKLAGGRPISTLLRLTTKQQPPRAQSPKKSDDVDALDPQSFGEAPDAGGSASSGGDDGSGACSGSFVADAKDIAIVLVGDKDGDGMYCMVRDKELNKDTPDIFVIIKKTASSTYAKCKGCRSLSVKVSRALSKRSDLKDQWGTMTKDEKKAFYLANAGAVSLDVPSAISECLRHAYKESISQSFATSGDWIDEIDLKEKFKDKPDQLRSIMANAKQIWCPIRSTTLYEVLNYKSNTLDEKAAEKSRLLQCEQEGHIEATMNAPRPKGAAKAKSARITTAAKAKIEQLLSTAKEICGRMENQTNDEHRRAFLPEKLTATRRLLLHELN
jgi:hypothetical protein